MLLLISLRRDSTIFLLRPCLPSSTCGDYAKDPVWERHSWNLWPYLPNFNWMITFVRLPETSVFYKRIDNSPPPYFFVRLFFPFWVLGSSKQADSVQSHSDLRAFPPQFSPRIYNSFFEIRVHSPCNYTDIPWPAQSETIWVAASVLSAPVLNAAITFCQLGSFVLYAISSSRRCHLIHGISELNVCCVILSKGGDRL